jgi:cell division protein ZapA (FtsZ GTPase activity inhibitor)
VSTQNTVSLTLLGRPFRLAAPAGEEERLRRAAEIVERQCDQVAAGMPRPELERVLLLAALELAASTVPGGSGASLDAGRPDPELETRLTVLRERVERVLADTATISAAR